MTPEQKMTKLLEGIGETLRAKDEAISLKDWQIENLNKEIKTLKEVIETLEKENTMLEDALKDAEAELDKYKGGAVYVD
jgi:predicted RNase H-like nuclease (RuvC/YqgF family)